MKFYYFSFAKHAHDIQFRIYRLQNTIDAAWYGNIKLSSEQIEQMEKEIEDLDEVLNCWDGRPASKVPADLYGVAINAVNWARETRTASCIANGREDLLQYC